MAEVTHHRDENVERLEAFLTLVSSTRGAVTAIQSELDAENDALVDQVAAGVGRIQGFREALGALTETFATAHQEAAAELGNLALAATVMTEQRLEETRAKLDGSREAFASGVAGTRENLDAAMAELQQEFAQAEATLASLDEQLADLQAEEEQTFVALGVEVDGRGSAVASAATELDETLEGASSYLLEGLESYLAAAFETLSTHLEQESQPFLLDMFGDLGRNLTRCLDEYDVMVYAAGDDLTATTEPAMEDAAGAIEDQRKDGQAQMDRATETVLRPFADEVSKNIVAAARGAEIVSVLPQWVPQFAAAREVAAQVQELMNVFNPFG